jgi:hypothetical protein
MSGELDDQAYGSTTNGGGGPTVSADSSPPAPVELGRVCPACCLLNAFGHVFCTGCGAPLTAGTAQGATLGAAGEASDPAGTTTVALPVPEPVGVVALGDVPAPPGGSSSRPVGSRSRRYWPFLVLGLAIFAAGAAAVAFAVLWRSESRHAARVEAMLVRTESELAANRAALKKTEGSLAAMSTLAEKRKTVLMQTRDVLTQVDPLLSSVDAIQHQSGEIQTTSDKLSSDADQLVSSLATATNYLANTDPAYLDIAYYNSLIEAANSYFDSLRADESGLASSESSYGTASTKFATHADSFSAAVRKLQQQLKNATK